MAVEGFNVCGSFRLKLGSNTKIDVEQTKKNKELGKIQGSILERKN